MGGNIYMGILNKSIEIVAPDQVLLDVGVWVCYWGKSFRRGMLRCAHKRRYGLDIYIQGIGTDSLMANIYRKTKTIARIYGSSLPEILDKCDVELKKVNPTYTLNKSPKGAGQTNTQPN